MRQRWIDILGMGAIFAFLGTFLFAETIPSGTEKSINDVVSETLTITSGGTLRYDADKDFGYAISASGAGVDSKGAIYMTNGTTNTVSGALTVSSDAMFAVNAANGKLAFSGNISGGHLTVNTTGTNSSIAFGSSSVSLSKITIASGTLRLEKDAPGTFAVTNGIEVASTAKLDIAAKNTMGTWDVSSVPVTLNGGTLHNSGGTYANVSTLTLNNGHVTADGETSANVRYFLFSEKITSTGTSDITASRITIRTPSFSSKGTVGQIEVSDGTLKISSEYLRFEEDVNNPTAIASIQKSGAGTLILTGQIDETNKKPAGVTVNAGVLQYGDNTPYGMMIPSGTTTVKASATLKFNLSTAQTNTSPLTLTGATLENAGKEVTLDGKATVTDGLTKSGAGTIALTHGENTFAGALSVTGGTLAVGKLEGFDSISLANSANLEVNVASGSTELSKAISGNGSLTKTGAGTLSISTKQTYTGGTFVKEGTLSLCYPNDAGTLPGVSTPDMPHTYAQHYPVTVEDGATLAVDANTALGSANNNPSRITLHGGTMKNNSGTYSTINELYLYGASMQKTSAARIGFMLDNDVNVGVLEDALGNTVRAESVIDSNVKLLYRIKNSSGVQDYKKVFQVEEGAILRINSDLTANESTPITVRKTGEGTMILNGDAWNVVSNVSTGKSLNLNVTGGTFATTNETDFNGNAVTFADGTTAILGGDFTNTDLTINGTWQVDSDSLLNLLGNSGSILFGENFILSAEDITDPTLVLDATGASETIRNYLSSYDWAGHYRGLESVGYSNGLLTAGVPLVEGVPEPASWLLLMLGVLFLRLRNNGARE